MAKSRVDQLEMHAQPTSLIADPAIVLALCWLSGCRSQSHQWEYLGRPQGGATLQHRPPKSGRTLALRVCVCGSCLGEQQLLRDAVANDINQHRCLSNHWGVVVSAFPFVERGCIRLQREGVFMYASVFAAIQPLCYWTVATTLPMANSSAECGTAQ